jgi:hypothetical protein
MSRLPPEPSLPSEPSRLNVVVVPDPPEMRPAIIEANSINAMKMLMVHLNQSPWRCTFNITIPAGKLVADWTRVGSTAGFMLWKWQERRVAATLVLSGNNADDCFAIERLTHTVSSTGPVLSSSLRKRIRECSRPMVGIVFGESDPATHRALIDFSVGLSKVLCEQLRIKQPRPGLGTAMPRDFPSRFFHLCVVNGTIKGRFWPESKAFRELPNLQQLVTTFMDRLDDSFEKFDERIVQRREEGDNHLRVEWIGSHQTAGVAVLTDNKGHRHKLLLLSGKDPAADSAVIKDFASTVPYFLTGLFEVPLREFETGPRPMLVEMIGVEGEKLDPAAGPAAQALAMAFFRRLGVF